MSQRPLELSDNFFVIRNRVASLLFILDDKKIFCRHVWFATPICDDKINLHGLDSLEICDGVFFTVGEEFTH